MNNHNLNLFLAALAAVPGPMIDMLSRGQRRIGPKCGARKARGPLPASKLDYHELLQPYLGKAYRHRFTGQVRVVAKGVFQGTLAMARDTFYTGPAHGVCYRSPRKALDWLRNAVEV